MNDNWKFSDLPYTSPDVEALQARYDALTQRAKDAQDSEDLLEVVRQRDALQQEVTSARASPSSGPSTMSLTSFISGSCRRPCPDWRRWIRSLCPWS
ncbi:MAG: hypothetical protein ACLTGT_02945 [Oscillospiraceae bacterium]